MEKTMPIDIVITWVDGKDPAHKKKLQPFLDAEISVSEDIAGPTRFNSDKEIFYLVASVFRFASFVRKIYIVTDNQNPGLDDFIRKNFPESNIPIEIVDHRVIFRGYEQYLPSFSSRAIETLVYRIPGLSEYFVCCNDDFVLLRDIRPEDWFIDGKSVARGAWRTNFMDIFSFSYIKRRKRVNAVIFKDSMKNAAKYLGIKNKFFHISHTPHPIIKSVSEDLYKKHPEILLVNISHRFRHPKTYSVFSLYYMWAIMQGKCVAKKGKELYLKPVGRDDNYVSKKLASAERTNPYWGCIQSMDMANEKDRKEIYDWLKSLLNIEI